MRVHEKTHATIVKVRSIASQLQPRQVRNHRLVAFNSSSSIFFNSESSRAYDHFFATLYDCSFAATEIQGDKKENSLIRIGGSFSSLLEIQSS